jgi:PadR family transcriptional regulator PadR
LIDRLNLAVDLSPPFLLAIMLTMSAIEPLGEFEHIVLLAVLRLREEAYAVPVGEEIQKHTGRAVSRGSIYITLDRLETKGYLRSWLGDPTPERGGRAKRYYALRPRAVAALRDSRRALVSLWQGLEGALA